MQSYWNTVLASFKSQAALARKNEARRDRMKDMVDVYHGRREKVKKLVGAELKRVSEIDIERVPWLKVDIAKRIIDTMAVIYKRPAVRWAGDPGEPADPAKPGSGREPDDGYTTYQNILRASNIGAQAPKWDAMGRVCQTVLVRPVVVDPEADVPVVDFRIYLPSFCDVVPTKDDYLTPERVQYYMVFETEFGSVETEVYEWTADTAVKLTTFGSKAMPGAEDKRNPYGELPFAVLRLEDMGDFWGEGANDLVDGSIAFMAQYAALLKNGLDQGFSRQLAINCGLEPGKVTAGSEASQGGTVVKLGSDTVIAVDGVKPEDTPPSFTSTTPDPKLEPLTKVVNNMVQLLCWRYRLSADRAVNLMQGAVGSSQQSGVAKSLDAADLEELRQRDLESYRRFEKQLYQKLRTVLRVDAQIELPDPDTFRIDFAELQVKKTFSEIKAEREHRIAMNLATPVDFIQEENPDLDDAEALELFRANARLNEELLRTNVLRGALPESGPDPFAGI